MNDADAPDMARQLRRWGPIAVLALVAIVVVVVLVSSGGGDDDTAGDDTVVTDDDDADDDGADDDTTPDDDADDTTPADDADDTTTPADDDDDVVDPEADGVVFWSEAEAAGTTGDYDWGDRCDTERGLLAYPNFFAAECVVPFTGDNGGETSPGVTGDTIKIVWYTNPEIDPVLDYITGPINNDDTPDEIVATIEGLTEFYGSFFETYGRTVEVIRYDATGPSDDEVTARADAETIARDIRPFMVWNAPTLAPIPFAETLAANDVMCACGDGEAARGQPAVPAHHREVGRAEPPPVGRVHRQAPEGAATPSTVATSSTRSGCSATSTSRRATSRSPWPRPSATSSATSGGWSWPRWCPTS